MALYDLAETCEYGSMKEEMIRDRLVVDIRDDALSQKLQLDATLSYQNDRVDDLSSHCKLLNRTDKNLVQRLRPADSAHAAGKASIQKRSVQLEKPSVIDAIALVTTVPFATQSQSQQLQPAPPPS